MFGLFSTTVSGSDRGRHPLALLRICTTSMYLQAEMHSDNMWPGRHLFRAQKVSCHQPSTKSQVHYKLTITRYIFLIMGCYKWLWLGYSLVNSELMAEVLSAEGPLPEQVQLLSTWVPLSCPREQGSGLSRCTLWWNTALWPMVTSEIKHFVAIEEDDAFF